MEANITKRVIVLFGVCAILFVLYILGAKVCCLSFMRFSFGILCTLIGAAFAYFKWSEAVNLRRNELLRDLIGDFSSKGHEATYYKYIERYCPRFYDDGKLAFFDGVEECIDRMLLFFNHVLYLKHSGVLTRQETVWFEYYIESIVSDAQICQYLDDLSEFCKTHDRKFPFEWLMAFRNERAERRLSSPSDVEDVAANQTCPRNDFCDRIKRLEEWMCQKGTRLRTAQSILARVRAINKVVDISGVSKDAKDEALFDLVDRVLVRIEQEPNKDVVASWRSAFGKYYLANTGKEPYFLQRLNKRAQSGEVAV